MKILLLTELYLPVINGVVTSTSTLCNALQELGHDVRVLSLASRQLIQDNIYYNKAYSANFIYPNAFFSLFLDKNIYKEILAWNPDILHTQSEFSTLNFAKQISKKLHIPIVHTYHTSYEDYTHYFLMPKEKGKKLVAHALRKRLEPLSHIIAPSLKIKNMLEEYAINKDISIIPTGINLDFPIFTQEERNKLKRDMGIASGKKIFLFLGRLAKEKNVDILLEYMAKTKHEDWFLLIAGNGPHKGQLEKKAKELNVLEKIHFTGMVERENVYKYYQLADVFVSASTSETQGLTYIEALANSLPLLCKYDTCLDNVLIPNKNGCFFNSFEDFEENAFSLFQQIKEKKVKAEAFKSVKHYSKQEFAKQILKVYEELTIL